jgi:hypothetical protein
MAYTDLQHSILNHTQSTDLFVGVFQQLLSSLFTVSVNLTLRSHSQFDDPYLGTKSKDIGSVVHSPRPHLLK